MSHCSVDTLGAFALRVDHQLAPSPSTQKARALLVYLVMHRGADIARERLMELFWPDADPDRARDSLRSALHAIRRSLRDGGVDPDGYVFANKSIARWTAQTVLDTERLAELSKADDRASLSEALTLYRGDFLEGDYDNWSVVQRERIAATYELLLSRAVKDIKDPAAAEKLIARNPYEEDAYTTLIDAALAEGRSLAAAQLAKRCRGALAEIGATPSPEFEQRYRNLELAGTQPTEPPRLPFCGRDEALGRVLGHVKAARQGNGALIVVSGEPGVGKTALLHHIADLAFSHGMRALRVRFVPEDPRPFGAWGPLFKSLTGRPFLEFVKEQGDKVVSAAASSICAALGTPTALLADDAQYLSHESLDLLGSIAGLAAASGHVLVVVTRPEGQSRLSSVFGETARDEIALERLTSAQLSEALSAGGFTEHDELANLLFKRTLGNPLYVESLLDGLLKSGTLRREGRQWQLAAPLSADVAVPKTLARSIEARLRSRGEAAATVACALALEPQATGDDFEAVLQMDETTVMDALDDLLSLGVMAQPARGPQFVFTHDLVREAAATLLNAARRVRLHRAFATRLEKIEAPDVALRKARHLEAAREMMPAARAYLAASLQAMEFYATSEALDRARRAVEILETLDPTPPVNLLLSQVHTVRTRVLRRANLYEQARKPAAASIRFARASGDPRQLLEALSRAASIQTDLGTIAGSAEAAEALKVALALGDDEWIGTAHAHIGLGQLWDLNQEGALESGKAALAAALRSGVPACIGGAADVLQRAQAAWWDFEGANATLALFREASRATGWVIEAGALAWTTHFHYFAAQYDAARSAARAALEITSAQMRTLAADTDLGIPAIYYIVEGFAAVVAIEQSDFDAALRYASLPQRHPSSAAPYLRNYSSMVPIDALLLRDEAGDTDRVRELLDTMSELYYPAWVVSHLVPHALRARVAARVHAPEAGEMVRQALLDAERVAARCPSDSYRAFDRLAVAAAEAGDTDTGARAIGLRDRYRALHARAVSGLALVPG